MWSRSITNIKWFRKKIFRSRDASVVPLSLPGAGSCSAARERPAAGCSSSCNSGGLEANLVGVVTDNVDNQQGMSSCAAPFTNADECQPGLAGSMLQSSNASTVTQKKVERLVPDAAFLEEDADSGQSMTSASGEPSGDNVADTAYVCSYQNFGPVCSDEVSAISRKVANACPVPRSEACVSTTDEISWISEASLHSLTFSCSEDVVHEIAEVAEECNSEASNSVVFPISSHGALASSLDVGTQSDIAWNGNVLVCSRCAKPPRCRDSLNGKWQMCPVQHGAPFWMQFLRIQDRSVECADGKFCKLTLNQHRNLLLSGGRLSLLPNGMMQRESKASGVTSTFIRVSESVQPCYTQRKFEKRETVDTAPFYTMDDEGSHSCKDTEIQAALSVFYMCICDVAPFDLYDGIWSARQISGKCPSKRIRCGVKSLFVRGVMIKDRHGKTFTSCMRDTYLEFAYGLLQMEFAGLVLVGEGYVVHYQQCDARSQTLSQTEHSKTSISTSLNTSVAIAGPDEETTQTKEGICSRTNTFDNLLTLL